MTRSRFSLSVAVLMLAGASALAAAPPEKELNAIRRVESADGKLLTSPKGAIGPYQIMPATWREFADKSWPISNDETRGREVCRRYLAWIRDRLRKQLGHEPDDRLVYAAYNGGIGRLKRCGHEVAKMPAETREYVRRVEAALR